MAGVRRTGHHTAEHPQHLRGPRRARWCGPSESVWSTGARIRTLSSLAPRLPVLVHAVPRDCRTRNLGAVWLRRPLWDPPASAPPPGPASSACVCLSRWQALDVISYQPLRAPFRACPVVRAWGVEPGPLQGKHWEGGSVFGAPCGAPADPPCSQASPTPSCASGPPGLFGTVWLRHVCSSPVRPYAPGLREAREGGRVCRQDGVPGKQGTQLPRGSRLGDGGL